MTEPTIESAADTPAVDGTAEGPVVGGDAALVGSPPGALPEALGGEAALVGNREAEGGLPDGAVEYTADTPRPEPVSEPEPVESPAVTAAPTEAVAEPEPPAGEVL